jgi:hypothetical protein
MSQKERQRALRADRRAQWREYYITRRAERLVQAGFWPLPSGWCDDLLGEAFAEPEIDCVWPVWPRPYPLPMEPWLPKPRLVRKDGKAVGDE